MNRYLITLIILIATTQSFNTSIVIGKQNESYTFTINNEILQQTKLIPITHDTFKFESIRSIKKYTSNKIIAAIATSNYARLAVLDLSTDLASLSPQYFVLDDCYSPGFISTTQDKSRIIVGCADGLQYWNSIIIIDAHVQFKDVLKWKIFNQSHRLKTNTKSLEQEKNQHIQKQYLFNVNATHTTIWNYKINHTYYLDCVNFLTKDKRFTNKYTKTNASNNKTKQFLFVELQENNHTQIVVYDITSKQNHTKRSLIVSNINEECLPCLSNCDCPPAFINNTQIDIPDNNAGGIESFITIPAIAVNIESFQVFVKIEHSFVGDLRISLSEQVSSSYGLLMNLPGANDTIEGCDVINMEILFTDSSVNCLPLIQEDCPQTSAPFCGDYQPYEKFVDYFDDVDFLSITSWTLTVSDLSADETGSLIEWKILSPSFTDIEVKDSPSVCRDDEGGRTDNSQTCQMCIEITNKCSMFSEENLCCYGTVCGLDSNGIDNICCITNLNDGCQDDAQCCGDLFCDNGKCKDCQSDTGEQCQERNDCCGDLICNNWKCQTSNPTQNPTKNPTHSSDDSSDDNVFAGLIDGLADDDNNENRSNDYMVKIQLNSLITGSVWIIIGLVMFCVILIYCVWKRRAKKTSVSFDA